MGTIYFDKQGTSILKRFHCWMMEFVIEVPNEISELQNQQSSFDCWVFHLTYSSINIF